MFNIYIITHYIYMQILYLHGVLYMCICICIDIGIGTGV